MSSGSDLAGAFENISCLMSLLDLFDQAWQSGSAPDMSAFLELSRRSGLEQRQTLRELIKIDLEYRWRRQAYGNSSCFFLDEYSPIFIATGIEPKFAPDLIAEEYRIRHRWGDRPGHGEYQQRFPSEFDSLKNLLHEIDEKLKAEIRCGNSEPAKGTTGVASHLENNGLSPTLPFCAAPANANLPQIPGYRMLSVLGRGGMGVVYEAEHLALGRIVALKMIVAGAHAGSEQIARFCAEATAIARLQHPNIVQVFEIGTHDQLPYIALEFVGGGSLDKVLAGAPQNPTVAAQQIATLARAVHAAHQAGIIHRDLKPANVLITSDGIPKVTDFGLAKQLDSAEQATKSGAILGTPSYMSPEQAAGKVSGIGPATDVYALGAILYEMLTGRPPFRAATALDTVLQVLYEEPVPAKRLQPKVPSDLDTICHQCLEKDPSKRYASASALADDLLLFQEGRPITARPLGPLSRGWRWCRRNKYVAASLGSVFLTLLMATGVSNWFAWSEKQARKAAEQAQKNEARQAGLERQANQEAQRRSKEAEDARKLEEEANERSQTVAQNSILDQIFHLARTGHNSEMRVPLVSMPIARWGWECDRRLLEMNSGMQCRRVIGTHDWGITSLLVAPDAKTFISAGLDGRLLRWQAGQPEPRELQAGKWDPARNGWSLFLRKPTGSQPYVSADENLITTLAWLDPGKTFIAASVRGQLRLWDLRENNSTVLAQITDGACLNALSVEPVSRRILVGDHAGGVSLVQPGGKKSSRRQLDNSPIVAIVCWPKLGWIVAQHNGSLHCLDPETRKSLFPVRREPAPVWDVDLDSEKRYLAVAGSRLALYRLEASAAEMTLEQIHQPSVAGAPAEIQRVQWAPDGKHLLAHAAPKQLQVLTRDRLLVESTFDTVTALRPGDLPESLPPPIRRQTTAMIFSEDGRSLWTAGQDTCILEWPPTFQPVRTEFLVPDLRCLRFMASGLGSHLLCGLTNGQLHCLDSRTGKELHRPVVAHEKAVVDLATSALDGRIITAGADGRIRIWQLNHNGFHPVSPDIQHSRPLRAIAYHVERTGTELHRRIAATDVDDCVMVWNGSTGERLGMRSLADRDLPPAVSGSLGYNASGSMLAVNGPGTTFWIFRDDQLQDHLHPANVVSNGAGGASLAWHPQLPDVVAVADTNGRLNVPKDLIKDPRWLISLHSRRDRAVSGHYQHLTFNPDGRRLAALTENGIVLFDLMHAGEVWEELTPERQPFWIGFDPTGHRLLAAHRNGRVCIWETGRDRIEPAAGATHGWSAETLLEGVDARDLILAARRPACFDTQGKLAVLYSVAEEHGSVPELSRIVRLGFHGSDGFHPGRIILQAPDIAARNGLERTMALFLMDNSIKIAYRRTRSDLRGGDGAVLVWHDPATDREQVIGPPDNAWFDLHAIPRPDGAVFFAHFSFDGFHFLGKVHSQDAPPEGGAAFRLGRQGDGYYQHARTGIDGTMHVVFRPNRFGGDLSPPTYLRIEPLKHSLVNRELIDTAPSLLSGGIVPDGLALSADQEPVVAYTRASTAGHVELMLSRRGREGWHTVTMIDCLPLRAQVSGLVQEPDGRFGTVIIDQAGRRLIYLSGRPNDWKTELIWQDSSLDGGDDWSIHTALVLNPKGQPIVLAWRQSNRHGWLRLFQRQ
jgi:serine/threonine protein kinase/WD40 repeat protein